VNTYLFLAFASVWLIFILYVWNLSRRQAKLKNDLEELKARLGDSHPDK
jgi:CcmD family protein